MKEPASEGLINEEFSFPRAVYSQKKASGNLLVFPAPQEIGSLLDWIFVNENK
jgi:hypothetical protein